MQLLNDIFCIKQRGAFCCVPCMPMSTLLSHAKGLSERRCEERNVCCIKYFAAVEDAGRRATCVAKVGLVTHSVRG